MSGADGAKTVAFERSNPARAVELVREFASPAGESVYVDVRPLDVPASALPEVKGLFGRAKKAKTPSFQVVYCGHTAGDEVSVISLDAPGLAVGDVLDAAGVVPPAGSDTEGGKGYLVVDVPAGATPEQLLGFGLDAMRAVLGGWEGRYEATGVDTTDFTTEGPPAE